VSKRRRGRRGLRTYHFRFTGKEQRDATVRIANQTLTVAGGFQGTADLVVTADSETWLGFLNKKRNILWAMVTGKVRLKGPIRLLRAFGKCFSR
jgi:putative sterol carrier protein